VRVVELNWIQQNEIHTMITIIISIDNFLGFEPKYVIFSHTEPPNWILSKHLCPKSSCVVIKKVGIGAAKRKHKSWTH
jgi:hypothetical protein